MGGSNIKMKMFVRTFVFAGALAIAPALAGADIYVECDPTDGVSSVVSVRKGLDCTEKLNKLKIQVRDKDNNSIDGCDAVSGGAPWDVWSAAKWGSKITQANAALIDHVELKARGAAFGSCNLSGSANSAGANMAGNLGFKTATGDRIKGGKSNFIARVGADLPSQSAVLNGIVSKGLGAGGVIRVLVGLDVGAPQNSNLLACNLGLACPPDLPEDGAVEEIALITNSASVLRIGSPENAECTAVNDPWDCCSGAGAGSCDD